MSDRPSRDSSSNGGPNGPEELECVEKCDEEVALELRSAWNPSELPLAEHDALIARAFRSVEVREMALEGSGEEGAPGTSDYHEILGALSAAYRPGVLSDDENLRLIREQGLTATAPRAAAKGQSLQTGLARRSGRIAGAAAGLAMAAVFAAVWLNRSNQQQSFSSPSAATRDPGPQGAVYAHTTTDLFEREAAFPVRGGESKRVDRIASSRAREYRISRYERWGAR